MFYVIMGYSIPYVIQGMYLFCQQNSLSFHYAVSWFDDVKRQNRTIVNGIWSHNRQLRTRPKSNILCENRSIPSIEYEFNRKFQHCLNMRMVKLTGKTSWREAFAVLLKGSFDWHRMRQYAKMYKNRLSLWSLVVQWTKHAVC